LSAEKDLLALKIGNGLLNHPTKDVSRELALGIVPFLSGHHSSPRSLRIWRFIHQRRVCSAWQVALMLPIK